MDGPTEQQPPPPAKKPRVEAPPDVPLDVCDIPLVLDAVRRNNAETRPKHRRRPLELLSDTFVTAALGHHGGGGGGPEPDRAVALRILDALIGRHRALPRADALGRVLFAWHRAGHTADSRAVVERLLDARASLPAAVVAQAVTESVASVSARVVVAACLAEGGSGGLRAAVATVRRLLDAAPMKRRLLAPLFEACADGGDAALGLELLQLARSCGLELWDEDYASLLRAAERARPAAATAAAGTAAALLTTAALEAMEDHHPTVGAANGEALQRLLGGERTAVDDETGVCRRCGTSLRTFDLTPAERGVLVADLVAKLIEPRFAARSAYDAEAAGTDAVAPEEQGRRRAEFAAFVAGVAAADYDTVIDGANVGYYGLSNWYADAKRQLVAARGLPPPLPAALARVPFPVDVPPRLAMVDRVVAQTRAQGLRPIVVLHERHTGAAAPPENVEVLRRWQQGLDGVGGVGGGASSVLLRSPGFVNDDYCWLYACLQRPQCWVVTNDLMRDHHFQLLSQRAFVRWRQRHRVTYRAVRPAGAAVVAAPLLVLRRPRPYSVWVQQAAATAAAAAVRWHVPIVTTARVIAQATNGTAADVTELDKDGDDRCDAWLCTAPA